MYYHLKFLLNNSEKNKEEYSSQCNWLKYLRFHFKKTFHFESFIHKKINHHLSKNRFPSCKSIIKNILYFLTQKNYFKFNKFLIKF
jgi:hypothetical protein